MDGGMRAMRTLALGWAIALAPAAALAADGAFAPTGMLRAAYLAGNAAQAVKDPATGEVKGVAADLARELARRLGVQHTMIGIEGVPAVMTAVIDGKADIGFLANDPSRAGQIQFTQTYLRNPQSLIVASASPIQRFEDLDQPGRTLSGRKNDSITLYLSRTLKSAKLSQLDSDADVPKLLVEGSIDAFGANRIRLEAMAAKDPRLRVLPGTVLGVPQAIIVRSDQPRNLQALDAFLNEVRSSGFLETAIRRAANGTEMEPAP
jgi:polar amino acid transport system substrate-binding protein